MLLKEIESLNYIGKNRECFLAVKDDWKRTRTEDYSVIGQIGKFKIHTNNNSNYIFYGLFDSNKKRYALFVSLFHFQGLKNVLGISQIGVDTPYQGMGLPVKFYTWLIQQKRIILVSGDAQSLGGRSIWERLAKVSGIFVFGYDFRKKQPFQIDVDDFYNEDIYSSDVEEENEQVQKEVEELLRQRVAFHPDSPEYRRLSKEISKLHDKLANLYKYAKHIENEIRLVAIKGRNK